VTGAPYRDRGIRRPGPVAVTVPAALSLNALIETESLSASAGRIRVACLVLGEQRAVGLVEGIGMAEQPPVGRLRSVVRLGHRGSSAGL
jgi:hypothetical protein